MVKDTDNNIETMFSMSAGTAWAYSPLNIDKPSLFNIPDDMKPYYNYRVIPAASLSPEQQKSS